MVAAAGRYGLVVGAEGDGEDALAVTFLEVFFLVSFELLDQRAVGGVPQLHAPVIAARNDLFAVVVPGQGVYGRRLRSWHGDLMGLDFLDYLPLGDVPNAHRSIVATRREPQSIGAEGDCINQIGMAQRLAGIVRREFPGLDSFIMAAAVERQPVRCEGDPGGSR